MVLDDPFAVDSPEPLVLVPAINPNVTVIHTQQADTQGTVRIAGLTFADVEQARAARHVIVTCEELVEPEVLCAEPDRNYIPFVAVDAVVGILGAAQVDRYGNLNSTCIGSYELPTVRFPGSGGACDVGSFVGRTIVFIRHERRRFVEQLDYLATPGYLDGPGGRRRAGYRHGGPACVISGRALLRFDEVSKEMYLDRYYPGTTPEEIQAHTSFPLDLSRAAPLDPPTAEELRILRQEVDPQRLILV